jgi:hypothetical protein
VNMMVILRTGGFFHAETIVQQDSGNREPMDKLHRSMNHVLSGAGSCDRRRAHHHAANRKDFCPPYMHSGGDDGGPL